jgi:hypothetical protein
MEWLSIGGCKNTYDSCVLEISKNLKRLTMLDLAVTKITDKSMSVLSQLPLEDIGLSQCKLSSLAIQQLMEASVTLRKIALFNIKDLEDELILVIFKQFVKLQMLDISECAAVTDRAFSGVIPSTLETLNLLRNVQLTDVSVRYVWLKRF